MSWVGILAIAIFFLYLLPWFAIHSWLLVTRGKALGGWDHEATTLTFVFGTIPLVNLFIAFHFFITPLWYRFKYRKGVPLPKVRDYD